MTRAVALTLAARAATIAAVACQPPSGASALPPGSLARPSVAAPPAPEPDLAAALSPLDAASPSTAVGLWNPGPDVETGPPPELADCDERLARAGVTFRHASLPVHAGKGKALCGAAQVVSILRGATGVVYEPAPIVTCQLALGLSAFEAIVQEEAARTFASPVARMIHLGTYSCREIARFKGIASEHSFANAIDVARFVLRDGRVVTVRDDFDASNAPPPRPGGAFLRAISTRAQDESAVSNLLTAFWDAAHRDHFHLDQARYRVNGVRP